MKRNPWLLVLALVALNMFATEAIANALMPSVVVNHLLFLVFGNFALGLIEGIGIGMWFRTNFLISVPTMIVANYFSSWIGSALLLLVFSGTLSFWPDRPYTGGLVAYMGTPLLAVPLTIALEAPFVLLIARFRRERPRMLRDVTRQSLICGAWVNGATASILAIVLLLNGDVALATQFKQSGDTAFMAGRTEFDRAWVCWVAADGTVQRARLDGSERSTLARLEYEGVYTELHAKLESDATFTLQALHFAAYYFDDNPPIVEDLASGFTQAGTAKVGHIPLADGTFVPDSPRNWSLTMRLQGDITDDRVLAPGLGFRFQGQGGLDGNFGFVTSLDRTFFQTDDETVLPEGVVVFSIGHRFDDKPDHIMVIDPVTRTIGHLARGHSPVVVYEAPEESTPTLQTP